MRKLQTLLLVAVVTVAVCAPAQARRSIGSGSSGYEVINKGVVDLGFFDCLLLMRYLNDSSRGASSFYVSFLGGFSPRYFLANNLALGLSLNLMAQKELTNEARTRVDSSDLGFLGLVTVHYFVRLGHGFFFKPGIGGGGFLGERDRPGADPGTVIESSLYGGAVLIDLGFSFYVSKYVNLRAGPDVLLRFGVDAPVNDDSTSFVAMDAGLAVGFGYSF